MSSLTLRMLVRMVTGEVSIKNVSVPLQIAQVAGYSAQMGVVAFLSFMAVVSVSLGVLNLLPVPVLDGGHLFYYGVEALKGSPLSERAQEAGQRVGLTMLVLLMGLRSEDHTSELQSLMRISYAVFCLKKKKTDKQSTKIHPIHIQ